MCTVFKYKQEKINKKGAKRHQTYKKNIVSSLHFYSEECGSRYQRFRIQEGEMETSPPLFPLSTFNCSIPSRVLRRGTGLGANKCPQLEENIG